MALVSPLFSLAHRCSAAVNPGEKFELVFRNLLEKLFVERMDQNEDIFVRYMNDMPFQKVVAAWMAEEAYRRFRSDKATDAASDEGSFPERIRVVEPTNSDRYATCVPLLPLKAAAGAFGDPQTVDENEWQWVSFSSKHRFRQGMFVAQVVGRSMEPMIPDRAYCLFRAPVDGSRQGKVVLVQLRSQTDAETGERYTVKRYASEKVTEQDAWEHSRITLSPANAEFQVMVFSGEEGAELRVIAEMVEVL